MVPKRGASFLLTFLLTCYACGAAAPRDHVATGSVPVLMNVEPSAASFGSSATIEGVGFSYVAQENVVVVGGASTVASIYSVTEDGSEQITFEVPEESQEGDGQLIVIVEGEPSNALPFTVNP